MAALNDRSPIDISRQSFDTFKGNGGTIVPTDRNFWMLSLVILLASGVFGFGIVPEWDQYYYTKEQRLEYLYESIWCPI